MHLRSLRRARMSILGMVALFVFLPVAAAPSVAAETVEPGSLASVPVADTDGLCLSAGAATFDDVIGAAATAIRTLVPAPNAAAYDAQVTDFRRAVAGIRVRPDAVPLDPATLGGPLPTISNPIVSYVVNGLDAIRTGRIDNTMAISRLTVNDAIQVFILANGIVKVPAQTAAGMVPVVGTVLRYSVKAANKVTDLLANRLQDHLRTICSAPDSYPDLALDGPETVTEPLDIPGPITDLANSMILANGTCTPIADLSMQKVVERTRDYLAASSLPLDRVAVHAAADTLVAALRENRVAQLALPRPAHELGPGVELIDNGVVTMLVGIGFGIYEGKALETVPLSEVTVENSFDLALLAVDFTTLMVGVGSKLIGLTGVGQLVSVPVDLLLPVITAPVDFGAPVVHGVMASMCAA